MATITNNEKMATKITFGQTVADVDHITQFSVPSTNTIGEPSIMKANEKTTKSGDENTATAERRFKRYHLPQYEIRSLFELSLCDVIRIPKVPLVPKGVKVEAVYYDYMFLGFSIIVSHPSFDPVPEGCEVPAVDHPLPVEHICLVRDGEIYRAQ